MRYYALAERPWIEEEDGAGYWGLPDGAIGSVDLAPLGSQSCVFVTSDQPISGEAVFGDGTRLDKHSLTSAERTAWTGLTGVALPSDVTLLDALWHMLTAAADPDGGERAKPIMPTHRGRLELHLGGHSLVRAEQMPADPTQHPAWPKIQAVLQNDYREIHDGPKPVSLARQRQSGNPTLARKYLGAMAQKYRLPSEAASSLLIPRDLPRAAALKPTTEIWDDFDRPDETLDGSQAPAGWEWRGPIGHVSLRILDGEVVYDSGAGQGWGTYRADLDLSSADHWSEVYVHGHSITQTAGVTARITTDESFYYARYGGTQSSSRGLGRRTTWNVSIIQPIPEMQSNDPGIVRLTADGSSISASVDGVQVGTVTDTQISGGLQAGLFLQMANFGAMMRDFRASDLLAPPVEITGDLDAVERGPDAATVRGSVAVTGSLSAREPASDTASITGSVGITGEIVARERGGDGAQVRGSAVAAASMAATEAGQDSASITGSAVISASLDAHEAGPDAATLRGTVAVTGAIDATEPASDTAEIIEGESGEITGTLDAREPGPDAATVVGSVAITGVMLAREPGGDGAQVRASVAVTGRADTVEPGVDSFDATGSAIVTGALDALEHGPDSAGIAGTVAITGDLDAVEPAGDTALFLEVVIDTPTPGERTFYIEPEDRSWCIAPDDRTFIVEAA